MIDPTALKSYLASHPETWFNADELAVALDAADEGQSVQNTIGRLFLTTYRAPPFETIPLASEVAAILKPGSPQSYHYGPTMSKTDWQEVVVACLAEAVGASVPSQSRRWCDQAGEALAALKALYQG